MKETDDEMHRRLKRELRREEEKEARIKQKADESLKAFLEGEAKRLERIREPKLRWFWRR